MEIKVLEARDEDMVRLFTIASLAFGTNEPFFTAFWPKHWTEAGREAGGRRLKNSKDRGVTTMKAVNEANGEIVGLATWDVFKNDVPNFNEINTDPGEHWEMEDDEAYAQYLATQVFAERRDAVVMSNGNAVCLNMLAVDPACQRQGVGAALVEWGTRRADELGVQAVVESSKFGKGLYEKMGFVFTKQVDVQVPQKWAHLGGQGFAWLIRPKQGA